MVARHLEEVLEKINLVLYSFLASFDLYDVTDPSCNGTGDLTREHSPLSEVSLYGWTPILLVWILPN